MILITDGSGSIGNAVQECVSKGVVVHTVAVTDAADSRLLDISTRTGGKTYACSGQGSSSLAATFSEIISSAVISNSLTPVTVRIEISVLLLKVHFQC